MAPTTHIALLRALVASHLGAGARAVCETNQQHQALPAAALQVLRSNSAARLLPCVPPTPAAAAAAAAATAAATARAAATSLLQPVGVTSARHFSSLRQELGSGAALGDVQTPAAEAATPPLTAGNKASSSSSSSSSSTEARRLSLLSKDGKRFYDTVVVEQVPPAAGSSSSSSSSGGGGYQLLLRNVPVKTPAKRLLLLPNLSMALAVAAEWEWLPGGKPTPHLMPLTGLACTAIDQPKEAPKVIEHLMKYVHTDAACIRYEPGPLERRQQRVFDPLLAWAAQEMGWVLATTHSIAGTTQPDATVTAVQALFEGLDPWRLAAVDQLVTTTKSVVLAAALLRGRLSAAQAVAAARLEEDFQLEDWGMVEAGHDLDIADVRTRVGAGAAFLRLLEL